MTQLETDIQNLSDLLIGEIIKALGLSETGWARQTFGPLFARVTERFANIGVQFDHLVAQSGFAKASEWALTNFVYGVKARGEENLPPEGPLLVVSNHPGAYDSLVITSRLLRDDVKFVSSDIPFLKNLPHANSHLIFTTLDAHDRMAAVRAGLRHLKKGGALLIFGSGHIDPDPAIFPDAQEHLDLWSPSLDLFLRLVPEARVLLSMVSGVLSRRWGYHPITWLRHKGLDKRRLAEFGQVIQQLLSPGRLMPPPSISFASPLTVAELKEDGHSDRLLPGIVQRAKTLLHEHCLTFGLSAAGTGHG